MIPLSSLTAKVVGHGSALIGRCESPIETAFAGAFLIHKSFEVRQHVDMWVLTHGGFCLTLRAQHEITNASDPWRGTKNPAGVLARVDFAFFDGERLALAVELDGHDFHQRDAKQVSRDFARERILIRCGFPVVRYSGTEIARDAVGFAVEAFAMAVTLGGLTK